MYFGHWFFITKELRMDSSTAKPPSDLQFEAEEFVLADITESSPVGYVGSLINSWCKDGAPPLSRHGVSTTHHSHSGVSPSLKTSGHARSRSYHVSWAAMVSIILMKFLVLFAIPVDIFGNILEYTLNLLSMNGGLRSFLLKLVFDRGSVKSPCMGESNYYSAIMLMDPQPELRVPDNVLNNPTALESDVGMKAMADVCVMAAKFAYENENVVKKTVQDIWKMNFVKFYNFWNDYLKMDATQAFIFTDKQQDANIVVVAFRGTQPFNMYDCCTGLDFSYYVLPSAGRVHVGFLEALGLGNRSHRESLNQAKINAIMKANKKISHANQTSGLCGDKLVAYDTICAQVRTILNENPRAKLYITGHSLGGALAALFTALIHIEHNDLCPRFGGTFTFGQPRVGDSQFTKYVEKKLCSSSPRKYFQVVYKADVAPCLPWDDVVFQIKYMSPCHNYCRSITRSMALVEEPYKNLPVSSMVQQMPHLSALGGLRLSLFVKVFKGTSTETDLAIFTRFFAVICPGLCAHSPGCYVDAVRMAPPSLC